jgi:hypothetical protein
MTKDEIIEMARQAGIIHPEMVAKHLEAFAKLVAQHEREACAKVCDEMEEEAEGTECCKWPTPIDCAYVIRTRGQA